MPTTKQSLYFTYDGVSCRDFGLIHISLDGGMFQEQFGAPREIVETTVNGSDTPLFHRIDETPLEFEMTIGFEKPFTDEVIDSVILWLFKDTYRPLVFEDSPNRVYHCMPVGEPQLAHNGLKEGYITLTMRNKSSKIYSPLTTTPTYDLSTNADIYDITIDNNGHVEIFPEISIKKIGDGNITITKDGEIFEIRDLTDQEDIYVNSEKEIIETDAIGISRYDDVVGDYHDMALQVGTNIFSVEGTCQITFRYMFKYKF